MSKEEDVVIHKASKLLQSKTGVGIVDSQTVQKAQKSLEQKKVAFEPMAQQFLENMAVILQNAKNKKDGDFSAIKRDLTNTIMQLKANGKMFDYPLITDLADMLLLFLESIPALDRDVIELININHKTLNLIIKNKMQGDAGPTGEALKTEIRSACQRYMAKRSAS